MFQRCDTVNQWPKLRLDEGRVVCCDVPSCFFKYLPIMFDKLGVSMLQSISPDASFGPLDVFHCQSAGPCVQVVYDQSLDKVELPADVVAEVQQSWQAFLAHAASQEAVAWY